MKTIAILMLLALPAFAAEPSPTPASTATPAPTATAAPDACGADGLPTDPTKPCTLVVNPLQSLSQRQAADRQTLQAVVNWIQQQQAQAKDAKPKK